MKRNALAKFFAVTTAMAVAVTPISAMANTYTSQVANVKLSKKKAQSVKLKTTEQTVTVGDSDVTFKLKAKAKGKVTFKKKSGDSNITVNKKGKVTVKTGISEGTYKLKVKLKAAAAGKFKAATATGTCTITVNTEGGTDTPTPDTPVVEDNTPVEQTISAGGVITDIQFGSNYTETTATDNDLINSPSASTNVVSVTINGTTYNAKYFNGKQGVFTLVMAGVQKDILDYYTSGEAVPDGAILISTPGTTTYSEMAKFMNMGGQTAQYTFRQALLVENGAINEDESIKALLANLDSYSATEAKGGALYSEGAFFNGITVDSSDFSIDGVTFDFIGDGANDFNGQAAVVLAQGSADVAISNSYIHSAGVIRTAAAAKGSGKLEITDSVIYAEEGNDTDEEYDALVVPMMKRTPFALGIEGTIRATNILGAGQGIYKDSLIVSSGWGVLSTDSGQSGTHALDVSNTTAAIGAVEVLDAAATTEGYYDVKEVNGTRYGVKIEGSGYVAYADSGVYDTFENVSFASEDYVQIMASNTSSATYTNSDLYSGRIAVMTQQNAGGEIAIKDSTVYAEDTVVQIKSGAANAGYTNVVFDNATIALGDDHNYGGTLVELVESDDAGNPGNTTYTINDEGEIAQYTTSTISDSNATLKNGEYNGNIWNNIYNYQEALNVTLDNATLTGTISSSVGSHMNQQNEAVANGTVLEAYTHADYRTGGLTDYLVIGAQYNTASEQLNNPINVTLSNNSTWNVVLADGTCGEADKIYINDLTVEAGSVVDSETPVTIVVYGNQDVKGTIGSNITIEKGTVDTTVVDTGITAMTQFYSGTKAYFKVQDESGNNLSSAASVEYQAFTNIQFTVTAADGYEIVSVTPDLGTLTEGSEQGLAYTWEQAADSTDAHTMTIVVRAK